MSDRFAEAGELYRERGLGGRVGFGERPALLVVDLSLGFTDPASPLAGDLGREIEATRRLLAAARAAGMPVHFTTIGFGEDPADGGAFVKKIRSLEILREGSRWVDLDPRLERRPHEPVWLKKGASAFFGTGLAAMLVAQRIDTLIVAGATTSGCVRASVVDGCQHNFRVIVVREAVGDRASAPHEAALFDMDAKYADVLSLEETLSHLAAAPRSGGGLLGS